MNHKKSYFIIPVALTLSLVMVTAVLAAVDHGYNATLPVVEPVIQTTNNQQNEKLVSENPASQRFSLLTGTPSEFETAFPRTRPETPGDWDGYRIVFPRVISNTGQYSMWYDGYNPANPGLGWMIGLAGSPDGLTWTKYAGNPVLGIGNPGDWDSQFRGQSAVLKEGSEYKMWYSGAYDGPWQTGYATSTNGINWNIYPGNPVLIVGDSGSWDEVETDGPTVIKDGSTYKMWYHGCNVDYSTCSIGYATSSDGINWTKYPNNPVLTPTLGAWDENLILWPTVLKNGGTYQMWYVGNGQIGLATSPDGITWAKYPGNPVLSQGWDGGGATGQTVLLEGSTYKMWFQSGVGASRGIGYAESNNGITWTMPVSNPVLVPGNAGVFIDVNYAHDWVEGYTGPDEAFTVTVSSDGGLFTVTGQADGNGWFGTHQWPWTPYQPNLFPGDSVTTTVAGGTAVVNPIGTIYADLDFNADTVAGTIEAPWFSPLALTVRCEVWVENGPPSIEVTGVNPDGGSYLCDFSTVGWDLLPGETVAVHYDEPDGDSVINIFEAPWMRINYAHDSVGGTYELGHTFWITLTDNGGVVKATAQLETQPGQGWGGDGFETQWWQWAPSQPDIQVNDWAYFQSDDGYFNVMRVGDISGTLDIDNNSVTGPIVANWFTETLNVECHPWGAWNAGWPNAPVINTSAEPDGSLPYLCPWDPVTEWDIQPGQDIGVMYIENDRDRVINVFREPAPNMRVEKWSEGSGQAMPGGPVVFTIRYTNDGDATANAIYLTDTLPINTTYLTDSSEVTPTLGSGWVAWTLGPLAPHEEARFQLVLANSANPGDWLHNQVDISTLYDFDFDNNHAEADVFVSDALPDLYVNKNPNPGDPAPGQTMLWEINYGNNGSVVGGPVVLTDTLPFSTSVVSWYSENGYDLWTAVTVNGDELVIEAPAVPGNWGDRLLLRLLVDSDTAVGTQLTNTVAITTPGDTNPGDNWHLRNDVWVNDPRWDGQIDKSFNWGTLIPGGEIDYDLHVRNAGNMASLAWITDTLPEGTSFAYAWLWTGQTNIPFPPDYVDDDIAYWDLGGLEPGEWMNINVHLNISSTVVPGTILDNCVEITIDGEDGWPYNNQSCVAETINDPGSNLRIKKNYRWNWEGTLHYEIKLENIGTTTEYDVAITDTLPVSTSFNGNWWHNWSSNEVQFTDLGDQLVWTLNRIEPTQNWHLFFDVDLDGNIIGVPGLAFTNTIVAPIPNDVNPIDNEATVIASTGPDVYVNQWLSGGLPRPGGIVTFTVEFGNQNPWPWWVVGPATITDVLPVEMTFITATTPWDPNQTWTPTILPGNTLVWDWGEMCTSCWWQFNLVVQITETVEAWEQLVNTIEIRSDNPADVEWDYGNNVATADITILHPQFAISKDYQSSEIAGMPVTYTLLVTNSGNWDDTGLIIHDLLPEYITYTSGGNYDPDTGIVTWAIPSLAQAESAEVAFNGVLACTANATVLNDTYQVVDSDEGVSSLPGAPISFNTLAPTLVATFDQSASNVLIGETVVFTSSSTTNGTPLTSWVWDFGDGGSGSGEGTTHAYTATGVYNVTLTITDACGFTETIVTTNAVTVMQTEFIIYLPALIKN